MIAAVMEVEPGEGLLLKGDGRYLITGFIRLLQGSPERMKLFRCRLKLYLGYLDHQEQS
jgi:hypothetical protein